MIKYFEQLPEIIAILSERKDGSTKLVEGELGKENLQNRERFFQLVELDENHVINAGLVHGTNVEVVTKNSEKFILNADALVTNEKNIPLAITIADCVPVYFYEKKRKIIGLAHAGWRGIAGGIVGKTVEKIIEMGSDVKDLYVAMGPGINQCHFEIKDNVLEKFMRYEQHIEKREGRMFVDLKGIVVEQLNEQGIEDMYIENDNVCTFEDDRFFSYRRDKPKIAETMLAVIVMK